MVPSEENQLVPKEVRWSAAGAGELRGWAPQGEAAAAAAACGRPGAPYPSEGAGVGGWVWEGQRRPCLGLTRLGFAVAPRAGGSVFVRGPGRERRVVRGGEGEAFLCGLVRGAGGRAWAWAVQGPGGGRRVAPVCVAACRETGLRGGVAGAGPAASVLGRELGRSRCQRSCAEPPGRAARLWAGRERRFAVRALSRAGPGGEMGLWVPQGVLE